MRLRDTFRARLTLWYMAVLSGTLVLFTVLLYAALTRALYRHHDGELAGAAEQIQRLLNGGPLDEVALDRALAASQTIGSLVMVRNASGDLRYRSALLTINEPNVGLHEALVHAAAHGATAPQFFTTVLERSGTVRFICVRVGTTPAGYVQIGRPLGDVEATLRTVRNTSLTLLPLVVLVTSYGGWMLAGRALSPITAIDRTLRGIHATDLARRVPATQAGGELDELATTVNQTLGRLEQAFASLRQFAADASHQLQTPLAVMKSSIEIAGRKNDSDAPAALQHLAAMVDELSSTVTSLQALALADADLASAGTGAVDFAGICHEALEIIVALAEPADIAIDAIIPPHQVVVWGDPIRLKQVVLNVGDNAIKYSRPGGRIRLVLTATSRAVILTIADAGQGIERHHLPHIFDRFFRGNHPSATAAGAGLGLAIVKRIVDVHGGEIDVTSTVDQGSSFTITLPLYTPAEV